MNEITWYLSFSDWLISLSIIFSRFIHAVAKGNISFFFNGHIEFHCVNVPQLFIHSSTDGHLGCFQILATVNNTAMNIQVHIFFWISVFGFLMYIPRSKIAGSKGSSIFEETPYCFPQCTAIISLNIASPLSSIFCLWDLIKCMSHFSFLTYLSYVSLPCLSELHPP